MREYRRGFYLFTHGCLLKESEKREESFLFVA